jgi:hypothetical protein
LWDIIPLASSNIQKYYTSWLWGLETIQVSAAIPSLLQSIDTTNYLLNQVVEETSEVSISGSTWSVVAFFVITCTITVVAWVQSLSNVVITEKTPIPSWYVLSKSIVSNKNQISIASGPALSTNRTTRSKFLVIW